MGWVSQVLNEKLIGAREQTIPSVQFWWEYVFLVRTQTLLRAQTRPCELLHCTGALGWHKIPLGLALFL